MKNSTRSRPAFVLASLLLAGALHAQSVERGPFLQMGTSDAMVVVWRTSQATDAVVHYGTAPGALTEQVAVSESKTQHEVRLTGLAAGTRYYYSVGTSDAVLAGGDDVHTFRTAPARGERAPFRMWILGDSGDGGSEQREVRDAMLAATTRREPDLFLHMGDIAYDDGTDDQLQSYFFDAYADTLRRTVVWPTIGNHEGHSSDSGSQSGPYYDAFVLPRGAEAGGIASGTEAYYSFDYANVHFIVLNSQDIPRDLDGAMFTWLRADLEATDQEWLVAYWHHPAYTKGTHDSDAESQLIEMRERALPILEAAGVDLVLAGHSHIYERSYLVDGAYDTPTTADGHIVDEGSGKLLEDGPYVKGSGVSAHAGAVYVVAGHGGAGVGGSADHPLMVVSEKDNGSALVDVDRNVLTLRNVRRDGVISDEFTLVKGDALVIGEPAAGAFVPSGGSIDVRWKAVGQVARVKVELSANGGESWFVVAADIENTGAFSFPAPNAVSERALVRVTSLDDPSLFDVTNEVFSFGDAAGIAENTPPVLDAIGDRALVIGETLHLTLSAVDAEGQPLFYAADGLPAGADLDPATGEVMWTADQEGEHVVTFAAVDLVDGRDEEVVVLTVQRPGSDPTDPAPGADQGGSPPGDDGGSSGSTAEKAEKAETAPRAGGAVEGCSQAAAGGSAPLLALALLGLRRRRAAG